MPTIMLSGRDWVTSACAEGLGLVALLRKPTDLDALLLLVGETAVAMAEPSGMPRN
jgi:hypothetical protein